MGSVRRAGYVVATALALAAAYQICFRYQYIPVQGVLMRVDHLTGATCVAWPPRGVFPEDLCASNRS